MWKVFMNFILETIKSYFLYVKIFFVWGKLKSFFYVLNNNFWYIQLFFSFLFQEDFYFDHSDTDSFFFFFFRKIFILASGLFLSFLFFFFRKVFLPLAYLFLRFFFVFLMISINHFYISIQKKYKNIFNSY